MENNSNNPDVIDLRVVFKKLLKKKMFFLKIWIVTFILSCAYILPQPRVYVSSLSLAPETSGQSVGGSLAGIASSFGIDLGGNTGSDAIYPELYPDLMSTNKFIVDMLYQNVKTDDGTVNTTYLDYLKKHCKQNPYAIPMNWCKNKIAQMMEDKSTVGSAGRMDPNHLSRKEDGIVERVRNDVTCDVDIKTNVITITAKAQDPLVCTTLANTACKKLQESITNYRTRKARVDADYYKHLLDSARVDYKIAVKKYSDYCDRNQDVILQNYISERDDLENTMQAKMTTCNAMEAQYEMALAKIQEKTPAFTILSDASVPVKPVGPKRMIFIAVMLFLATLGGAFYIFKDDLMA